MTSKILQPEKNVADTMNITRTVTTFPAFHDADWPAAEPLDTARRTIVADFCKRLHAGEISTEQKACLCGNDSFALIAEFDRYRFPQRTVLCTHCGLIQSMPRMDAKALQWFYNSDTYRKIYEPDVLNMTPALFDKKIAQCRHRFAFVTANQAVNSRHRVLEIGCAGGWNLKPFADAGMTVTGYDFSPNLTAFGRTQGLNLVAGGLDDVPADDRFDVIILSHVLEHFPDPVIIMKKLSDHLTDQGVIYIEVPNGKSFAFGSLQNAHTYLFTPDTLRHYAEKSGLKTNSISPVGPHMRGLFSPTDCTESVTPIDLSYEARSTISLIRRYEKRERFKHLLARMGLLSLAKAAARWTRHIVSRG